MHRCEFWQGQQWNEYHFHHLKFLYPQKNRRSSALLRSMENFPPELHAMNRIWMVGSVGSSILDLKNVWQLYFGKWRMANKNCQKGKTKWKKLNLNRACFSAILKIWWDRSRFQILITLNHLPLFPLHCSHVIHLVDAFQGYLLTCRFAPIHPNEHKTIYHYITIKYKGKWNDSNGFLQFTLTFNGKSVLILFSVEIMSVVAINFSIHWTTSIRSSAVFSAIWIGFWSENMRNWRKNVVVSMLSRLITIFVSESVFGTSI